MLRRFEEEKQIVQNRWVGIFFSLSFKKQIMVVGWMVEWSSSFRDYFGVVIDKKETTKSTVWCTQTHQFQ